MAIEFWRDNESIRDEFSLSAERLAEINARQITRAAEVAGESGDESKKDDGKAPYGLIPNEPLEALAQLYGLGARKYRPRGWEDGMAWQRIFDAMERHGRRWWGGETYDRVDGQHHLIAVAWCAFALYCYEVRDLGEDNRP